MKTLCFLLLLLAIPVDCPAAEIVPDRYVLENNSLSRTLSTKDGVLRTIQIVNKLSGLTITPDAAPEFRLRLSEGTDRPGTATTVTSSDFQVLTVRSHENGVTFELTNSARQLCVKVSY